MRHETLQPPSNPELHMPLGGTALHGEVTFDEQYIQEGIGLLEAEANRVHDVNAAHEAALIENEIFDVYDEAVLQNEIFDAHVEALREEEVRAAAAGKQQRIEEQMREADADQGADEKAPAPHVNDLRGQAEAALREEGITAPLPVGSQVRKDPATGNLMIIGKDDVKILEPQLNGRTKIVDYSFDQGSGVVTISAKGVNTLLAREGNYTDENRLKGNALTHAAVNLPPAVAAMAGFKRAVPIR